ncbi:MAG: GNAT family N-acetyltransferase [Pirellulaceae bacterium]
MEATRNILNQWVGLPVCGWHPPPVPQRSCLPGNYVRLDPLDPARHAPDLFRAYAADTQGSGWTYLGYGPFPDERAFRAWIDAIGFAADPLFFAITDQEHEHAGGMASYLRMTPASGSLEVGHIHYSSGLRGRRAATEAMYLMMRHAFELGYRRYEWKCDALNGPSRTAAQRLGLSFEGVFRQATVYKGRNRDTAWYAAIDSEWPALRTAFECWLDPQNFDIAGRQRVRLSELTAPIVKRWG